MRQFFEDNTGLLSMNRLTLFGAFIVTSAAFLADAYVGKLTEMTYGLYLGAWVTPYGIGKLTDKKESSNVDKT